MAGRPRKPTYLKILEGKQYGLNPNEPIPKEGGVCPSWLSKGAKKEWAKIAPELERLGLLTVVDTNQLAIYCTLISDIATLTKDIEREGLVVERTNNVGEKYSTTNQKVHVRKEAIALANSISTQFGFTPASRSKITIGPLGPEEGSIKDFIAKKFGTK